MTQIASYIPPSPLNWQGRADIPPESCFFQRVQMLDLAKPLPALNKPAFGLLGFCCDEGIRRNLGRAGAAKGPHALREMLAKLPLHRHDISCFDAGDIICREQDLEAAQQALSEAVFKLLQHHIMPIVIGGGHDLAWGHYQGIVKQFPQTPLGIINFDAHFDMRPLPAENKGSSGTPFLQIAKAHEEQQKPFHYYCLGIQQTGNIPSLFETAKHYQTRIVNADEIQLNKQAALKLIEHITTTHENIYLSVCLDVFASAYAPGVSAPQVLGLTPWQVIPHLRKLASSGKVVSYDIAELSPPHDIDSRTAKLAANLIYEIIHHHLF